MPIPPMGTTVGTGTGMITQPTSVEQLAEYTKSMENYENNNDVYEEKHSKAVAAFNIACEEGPKVHIKGFENRTLAYEKLKQQYGTTDLATVDMSLQEICRTNMTDKGSVHDFAEHLKRHLNEILSAGQLVPDWMMSSFFCMGLPQELNPYVFQLVHAAKQQGKDLTIDEMVAALVDQDKRASYMVEGKSDNARSAKSKDRGNKPKGSTNNGSHDHKKDCGEGPCDYCGMKEGHNTAHCYYKNPKQRPANWKPYETKIDLAKDWKDKAIFIPANDFKAKGASKVKRLKSTSSNSSEESTWLGKARMTRSTKATYTNKDPDFYLDSAADNHMSYNEQLFKDLKPLATVKTVEVANGELVAVKGIGSITFELNVHGKKICNTVTGVEFVPELDYNLIATGVLEKKGCEITQKKGRMFIVDEDDGLTFMTGTRQPSAIGNSYTLDLWTPPVSRAKVSKTPTSWIQWHRRLGHLNMGDVKKLAQMGLINANECNKVEKLNPEQKCEACILGKQHRIPNHNPVRANPQKRATRKGQRFHTDLAGGGNIVQTPRGKRYAIVFVDDYTDYTWIYLARLKSEFSKILRDFIMMIKAQGHSIESIRLDNAKENINTITEDLLKEHGIQWEPTVPYNPHQNGVAERAWRTIFSRVCACLYDSKLPRYLWGEACFTIVYLKNISPCTSLDQKELNDSTGRYTHNFKTPHEAWFGTKPDLNHLHPFGTLCYANKENTKKLDNQGVKCRLLGYGASNQYLV